jgi:hypothetical protein
VRNALTIGRDRYGNTVLSEDIITLISAIAALTAAAGGLWAARAAHRSAISAHEAVRQAEKVDRRGILRDLITTCHRLIAESVQIGSLAEELKTEYRMLATSSGQSGGSREKLHILRIESKQKEIFALQEEAQQQIRERGQLLNASEEDFMQALSKFDGYVVQALQVKSSLEREIASVAGNNRIYREGRIKAANQRVHNRDGR